MAGENGKLSGSRLSVIPVDGGEPQPGVGSENDEATLDIEDVSAIAPQAKIDVYEAPNTNVGGLDEYARIVDDDTDQIVSSSWAVCEQLAQYGNPGVQQAENLLFEQAAAQGQTVLSRPETPVTTSATRRAPLSLFWARTYFPFWTRAASPTSFLWAERR